MGKKGKDKKKAEDAGGGAGGDGADGGVNVDELNAKIVLLEKEKNKEEEYRNYMQVRCNVGERAKHAKQQRISD